MVWEESASYELNQLYGFWSPDDYYGFVNTFKYDKEKVTLEKYTIIEEARKRAVYNWLQYYSKDSLIKELKRIVLKWKKSIQMLPVKSSIINQPKLLL